MMFGTSYVRIKMWTKIKDFFSRCAGYIVAGLTAFAGVLLLVIKGKNSKIDKQKEEIKTLDKEVKIAETKAERTKKTDEIKEKVTNVVLESQKDEVRKVQEILITPDTEQAKVYNGIIEGFNHGKN